MSGRSTVLIVEDDIDLAEITCELLESAGLAAVFRTTLTDALEYLARNAATTTALITDINLQSPMGGTELAVYAAEEWPDLAICVMSGVGPVRPSRLPARASFLPKPCRSEDLIEFARAAARP